MGSIRDRDRAYRRRLYKMTPVAAAIVAMLFLTSDRVSLQNIDKRVGWKGELRLLPEVTILPDDDPTVVQERERELESMTSFDLDITESPEVVAPRFTNVERPKEDEFDFAENDDFEIRTDPARPKASYSDTYVLIKMVEPKYPPRELRGGIEGNVTVELYVNEEGVVDQAWVLSALGPMSFQESALEAVRQFVFKPATENGQPIPMSIRFVIKFRIFG